MHAIRQLRESGHATLADYEALLADAQSHKRASAGRTNRGFPGGVDRQLESHVAPLAQLNSGER